MLVSVHLPKTAGSSFALALQYSFGARLLRDYSDLPINTPPLERNRSALEQCLANERRDFGAIECIHGHFLPIKYLQLSFQRRVSFVTWMRHPVERMISHYHFWRRVSETNRLPSLHRRFVQENWSLERFCLGPELRNLYFQFLFGFPLENFSFIGITELYEEDHAHFSRNFLKTPAGVERVNVGEFDGRPYTISPVLRRDIEEYHAIDMTLYHRALALRRARLEG